MEQVLKYTAVLFPDPDGGYTVVVPALPGCITEGDTVEEALSMAKGAIELFLEASAEHGESVMKELIPPIIATVEVEEREKARIP